MISEIMDHMDYVLVVILALILYRFVGRPLLNKV